MNRALPSPQPARKPMIASTLPDSADSREKTTMSPSPVMSVALVPMRLETQLVTSIASPVTSK